MCVIPFRKNSIINDVMKTGFITHRYPTCTHTPAYLGAETNPEGADSKGFPIIERKGPLLLGAHEDFEC